MKYLINLKILFVLIFSGLLFANEVKAQDSSKNVFTASLNYQSTLHYFGRVDSMKSSGIFQIIGLKSKTGLYINSTFIFIQNNSSNNGYTGTLLEGGYRFPESKTISGNLYYSQYLYKPNSSLQQASIKSQTGINTTFNNPILNFSLNADAKFSRGNVDYGLSSGMDKLILFKNIIPNVVLAIDPTFFVNAGTQKFTTTTGNKNLLGLPSNSSTVIQYQRLSILSYEASMPVVLVRGKFNGYISPSFVLPQNVLLPDRSADKKNDGKNFFYIAAGVGVRF